MDMVIRETGMPAYEAATLNVIKDEVVDGRRELRLHLQSLANAEYINLLFSRDVNIAAASVNCDGKPALMIILSRFPLQSIHLNRTN